MAPIIKMVSDAWNMQELVAGAIVAVTAVVVLVLALLVVSKMRGYLEYFGKDDIVDAQRWETSAGGESGKERRDTIQTLMWWTVAVVVIHGAALTTLFAFHFDRWYAMVYGLGAALFTVLACSYTSGLGAVGNHSFTNSAGVTVENADLDVGRNYMRMGCAMAVVVAIYSVIAFGFSAYACYCAVKTKGDAEEKVGDEPKSLLGAGRAISSRGRPSAFPVGGSSAHW